MATACGKTILFGEHFVVYGLPAIAGSVSGKTTVKARMTAGMQGVKVTAKSKGHNIEFLEKVAVVLAKKLGIVEGLELEVDTELPIGAGMGSSAAFSVAATRALAKIIGRNLGNDDVSRIAYEGEKLAHGTPSGIDNTVATYGGLVWFVKNLEGGANTVERLTAGKPLDMVIGTCPRKGTTKELVEGVRARKEANPEKFARIFVEAKELAEEARVALKAGDEGKIGALMNRNHALLQEIGVSTKKLDRMCAAAMKAGALGTKLTGAGGGGSMIALCPGKQEAVKKAIEKLCWPAIAVRVGE